VKLDQFATPKPGATTRAVPGEPRGLAKVFWFFFSKKNNGNIPLGKKLEILCANINP
jgi:hypothetical protein